MLQNILRLPAVKAATGLSRSTIYSRIGKGLMTSSISLGGTAKGWPEEEVAAINAARISGKSDDQIRVLVARLEIARKAAA